jgi:glyoxylase-like metal-dependent hydrolase (beta-lactamase superfamily II)
MPPRVFQVCDRVYCVMRRSYFTCSYLVTMPHGGLVAVDAGMKSHGNDILAAIRQLRRSPGDVKAVLLTHWHNDHSAGAHELAELAGAEIYYSATEADHLTRRAAATGLRGRISAHIPETGPLVLLKGLLGNAPQQPVAATQFITGGETVCGEFEAIATPGHTAGHLSFYHAPTRTLFAGDALAVVNGQLRFMARPVTEDLSAARHSMARCLDRPIDHVCPGHREPLAREAQPQCERLRAHVLAGGHWPLLG